MNPIAIIIVLTLLVLARGYLELNAQFLVAISFVLFIYTAYIKIGQSLHETFTLRATNLINQYNTYYSHHVQVLENVIKTLNNNVALYSRLHTISELFKAQTQAYIAQKELDLEHDVEKILKGQLEAIAQREQAFILHFQKDLISKFISELHTINVTDDDDDLDLYSIVLHQPILPINTLIDLIDEDTSIEQPLA